MRQEMSYFSFEVKLNGEHKKQEMWEISDVEKQVFLGIQSKLGTQTEQHNTGFLIQRLNIFIFQKNYKTKKIP